MPESLDIQEIHARVKARQIHGFLKDEEAALLYHLALASDGPIVEIGSYMGLSSAYLAFGAREGLWCVDPWDTWSMEQALRVAYGSADDAYDVWRQNLEALGLMDRVTPVRARSDEAMLQVPCWVNMLFIDGDHTDKAVTRDLWAYEPKLRRGGALAMHDWTYRGDNGLDFHVMEMTQQYLKREWPYVPPITVVGDMAVMFKP